MNNDEVKKTKINLDIQKIFNIISLTFILACTIFYGSRFIILYIENKKMLEIKSLGETVKENNINNNSFKEVNKEYYFVGKNANNYIRYSNLLWRIIRVNKDNSVTLVLENSITSLAPVNNYRESYINIWLNNHEEEYTGILEGNLNNLSKYLSYTNTCSDKINDIKSISCKETTQDILITIPSINDYANTGSSNSFMNNGEYFYLINETSDNKMWYVDSYGKLSTSDKTDILGIKPVITIKNTIELVQGEGTKNNPYVIERENSMFGSYVKLDNDLWRIYSIDEDNVKLSLADYLEINNKDVKYKYSTTGYYHNDTKEGSLAYYLKNTYLPTLSYSNIIEEVKYSNGIYSNISNYDYKEVLKTKIDTKVTVLSIGDIFLNPKSTNYYTSTGLTKEGNLIYVMKNDFKPYLEVSTTNLRVIPVISINKNLLTTGVGTIDSPLEVNHE